MSRLMFEEPNFFIGFVLAKVCDYLVILFFDEELGESFVNSLVVNTLRSSEVILHESKLIHL